MKRHLIVQNMIHQSVSQARSDFAQLLKKVKKEPALIIQRSNPVAVMISVEDFNTLNKLRIKNQVENNNLRKLKEWESILPEMKITKKEATEIAEARKSRDSGITLEDFLNR